MFTVLTDGDTEYRHRDKSACHNDPSKSGPACHSYGGPCSILFRCDITLVGFQYDYR